MFHKISIVEDPLRHCFPGPFKKINSTLSMMIDHYLAIKRMLIVRIVLCASRFKTIEMSKKTKCYVLIYIHI